MLAPFRAATLHFMRDEDGATLVEYALLVALIAVVCIAAVTLIGTNVSTKLNSAANSLQ